MHLLFVQRSENEHESSAGDRLAGPIDEPSMLPSLVAAPNLNVAVVDTLTGLLGAIKNQRLETLSLHDDARSTGADKWLHETPIFVSRQRLAEGPLAERGSTRATLRVRGSFHPEIPALLRRARRVAYSRLSKHHNSNTRANNRVAALIHNPPDDVRARTQHDMDTLLSLCNREDQRMMKSRLNAKMRLFLLSAGNGKSTVLRRPVSKRRNASPLGIRPVNEGIAYGLAPLVMYGPLDAGRVLAKGQDDPRRLPAIPW